MEQIRIRLSIVIVGVILGFASQSLGAGPIFKGDLVTAEDPIAQTTVAIIITATDQTRSFCTGSILDSSHVLTSAHCMVDPYLEATIIFKTDRVFSRTLDQKFVRKVIAHKIGNGFGGNQAMPMSEYNDLALLTFNGGLPEGYKAISYLDPDRYRDVVKVGTPVKIAGYGKYDPTLPPDGQLRKSSVSILSQGLQKMNFWTESKACHGDSGGPAIVELNGENYLVGVFSRSDCKSIGIYVRYTGSLDNGVVEIQNNQIPD